jgi:hypothetical protein
MGGVPVTYAQKVRQQESYIRTLKRGLIHSLERTLRENSLDPPIRSEELALNAMLVAKAEGKLKVLQTLAMAEEKNLPRDMIMYRLMDLLTRNPMDEQQDRLNDVRRSYTDGVREAVDSAERMGL